VEGGAGDLAPQPRRQQRARSARAARTVAIDRSMSPLTQNWCTVTSDSMFGEM
jgi:hypothetical protein